MPLDSLLNGWVHDDGTVCPEYLADLPPAGTTWWCTTHQQHVRRPGEDLLAARLAVIRHEAGVCLATPNARASTRLIAANEAVHQSLANLLAGHADLPVFLGADDCDCPVPHEDAATDEWEADHPLGAADVGRICVLSEIGRCCPACTELRYDEEGAVGDEYVPASGCIVRPLIDQALAGASGTKEN